MVPPPHFTHGRYDPLGEIGVRPVIDLKQVVRIFQGHLLMRGEVGIARVVKQVIDAAKVL